jgi:hypothetical protein
MGFNTFDLESGVLSRHSSQEAMGKPYSFHGTFSREGEFSLLSANMDGQTNPAMTTDVTLNSPPDAHAIRVCQNLLSGHQGTIEGLSFSAANSNVSAMPSNSLNASVGTQTSGANQRAVHSIPFSPPGNRSDGQFVPMHEPAPYLRSPSPYWRYLPVSGSESLSQVPAILGTTVTLDGDSSLTGESMKQDGWVTSIAGYHDMMPQDEKPTVHRSAAPAFPVDGPWNGGLAPWSTQQPQSDRNLSRSSGLETNSVTGYPKSMVPSSQTSSSIFPSQSSTPLHSSHDLSGLLLQGEGAFDSLGRSSNVFRPVLNETPAWSLGPANISPSKGSLTIGHKANLNYPNMSTFAPSFVPSSIPTAGGNVPQFLSQVQSTGADQARTSFAQPRFSGSRSEDDEASLFHVVLFALINRTLRASTFFSFSNLTPSHLTMFSSTASSESRISKPRSSFSRS